MPSHPTTVLRASSMPTFLVAENNRSEEHTSELQSLKRNSYAVFCLKKKHELSQRNHNKNGPQEPTTTQSHTHHQRHTCKETTFTRIQLQTITMTNREQGNV